MVTLRSLSLKKRDFNNVGDSDEGLKKHQLIQKFWSFKKTKQFEENLLFQNKKMELDAAAIKLQKAYRSYRTRRNLADYVVLVEEHWSKALDFALLLRSSISFFESDRSESVASRWARASTRAAKLGKGLSKDEKAQKLALRHWLEAIDPRHRYGHNLHLYYDVWFASDSTQPFFYWLDVGNGKEENLETCPRNQLQRQCVKYLGPKEREAYVVVVVDGKLVYKQSGKAVETVEGTKWIFVLSASRILYVGQKEKGLFQHSSFLSGAAAIAAGRLIARHGVLQAAWSYSGHYRPTEENFMEFISFLEDQNIDLTHVKKYPMDDDIPPTKSIEKEPNLECMRIASSINIKEDATHKLGPIENDKFEKEENEQKIAEENVKALSRKWSTGLGPRIGCVREYPTNLQLQALEHVKLSPTNATIPPSFAIPYIHLSPRLACMGQLPSPRLHLSPTN